MSHHGKAPRWGQTLLVSPETGRKTRTRLEPSRGCAKPGSRGAAGRDAGPVDTPWQILCRLSSHDPFMRSARCGCARVSMWSVSMRISSLAAGLCLPLALAARAEPLSLDLQPLVVTASRLPETEESTLAAVSVIERDEIESRQYRSVTDALRGLPGVAVSGSGGPGQPPRSICVEPILVMSWSWSMGSRLARRPLGPRLGRICRSSRSSASRWCVGRAPASTAPRPSAG